MKDFVFDLQRFVKIGVTNVSDTVLSGTDDNDFIHCAPYLKPAIENIAINAKGGDDTVEAIHTNHLVINAGDGNDDIREYGGVDVKIFGGKGNDTITKSTGWEATIDAGADDDLIQLANNVTNTTVYCGTGNDTISSDGGAYVKIFGGEGNDYIAAGNSLTTIDSGTGNDTINGSGYILAGSGDNYIAGGREIYVGSGNNTILAYGGTLQSGNGNNLVLTRAGSLVNTGSGNDTILGKYNGTINAGKGDDQIITESRFVNGVISYAQGDGNDTIFGMNPFANSTFQITSGEITGSVQSGNDFIIYIGDEHVTFKNYAGGRLKLQLADGTIETVFATTDPKSLWSIKGGKATFGNYDEWIVDYAPRVDSKSIPTPVLANHASYVSIENLNENVTAEDIIYDGTAITLNANALSTEGMSGTYNVVKIAGCSRVILADDVPRGSTVTSGWGWYFNGTSATFKTVGRTGGCDEPSPTSGGASIRCWKASEAQELVTVNGLKKGATSADIQLNIPNKTVTLKANALGTGTVTSSSDYGYTLALADDVPTSTIKSAKWTVSGTTATYKGTRTAGYILARVC